MIDITGLREDKRPQSSTIVHALLDRLEAAEKERDELRAKVEAMEHQEPVAWIRGRDEHRRRKLSFEKPAKSSPDKFHWSPLYALPGAQPPSEQDESVRRAIVRAAAEIGRNMK